MKNLVFIQRILFFGTIILLFQGFVCAQSTSTSETILTSLTKNSEKDLIDIQPADTAIVTNTLPRREVLAIKTNLLFYGVYMPGYNRWCPLPNVAVEYYPTKGHFTFAASLDMPWWQNYDAHKYFQVRNYQVEGRYYLKVRGERYSEERHNYRNNLRTKEDVKQTTGIAGIAGAASVASETGAPAYTGWYLQGYVNGGVFGICFDADRGWVGEGFGAGVGVGYVLPVSRDGHWRLELGLQAGFFTCKYDPYQYENPVDPSYVDHLYYYKWTFDPSLFKKRQYHWYWVGPTRIGVTLSYDLLYRRISQRGVSFKKHEVPVLQTPALEGLENSNGRKEGSL